MFKKIKEFNKTATRFITHDIWHLGSEKLSRRDAFLVRTLKVIIICVRSFWEDKIAIRASALTLYTMMSIVPIAALIFAVAKGFNIDAQLQTVIMNSFPDQQEVAQWVMSFADSAIRNAKGGVIAGAGIVMLLWAVISMLNNVEKAFNHIWNVNKQRAMVRKFANYLSIMIIVPIFFVSASSISISLKYAVDSLAEASPFFSHLGGLVRFLLGLIPYVLIWLMFSMLYTVMPNTRVKFKYAFLAGVVAGTVFVLMQSLYVYSQVSISKYSAIYGSFAAIPLFILWAKFSWMIILFGAELSFAYQNVDSYQHEKDSDTMSMHQHKLLALVITRMLAKNFAEGEKAFTAEEISVKSEIPLRTVHTIVNSLVEAGVVSEIVGRNDKELAYQPAVDIHRITVSYVVSRIEVLNSKPNIVPPDVNSDRMTFVFDAEAVRFQTSPDNKLLIEL